MRLKKALSLIVGILLMLLLGIFSPVKSQEQALNQYLVLNRLAYYKVKVQIEIVGPTDEGYRINLYILEGRINGILNGEFVRDREIVINGSRTVNGDQTTIL